MEFKTFEINKEITYQELEMRDGCVAKFYEIRNPYHHEVKAIPDGSIDIQFVKKQKSSYAQLCGSLKSGGISQIGKYDYCFGVRFKTGQVPDCIRADLSEVISNRYALEELLKIEDLKRNIMNVNDFTDRIRLFSDMFNCNCSDEYTKTFTTYIINSINEKYGCVNIDKIVKEIGYSHCYTDKLFRKKTGMTPKNYANIVRLQAAIDIIKEDKKDELFNKLGFYDQAHFIREFKRFTAVTPTRFIRDMGEKRLV